MKKLINLLIIIFLILASGCSDKDNIVMKINDTKFPYNKELMDLLDAKSLGEQKIGWLKKSPSIIIEIKNENRMEIYHLYDLNNVKSFVVSLKIDNKFYELSIRNDKDYEKVKKLLRPYLEK